MGKLDRSLVFLCRTMLPLFSVLDSLHLCANAVRGRFSYRAELPSQLMNL